jgi:type VI secretion system secreted protein VgrG
VALSSISTPLGEDVLVLERLAGRDGISSPCEFRAEPQPRSYSVQWNETDFDYLSRRFEADGLFYWFEHQPATG